MKKCIVLLSGGMDSSTLLGLAKRECNEVKALTLIYGQRHQIEVQCAQDVAAYFNIPHLVMDVSNIRVLLQGSSLTSDIAVPKGHYEDESMKQTVVPGRNTILLSLALGYCVSQKFNVVAYAAHAGDHAIYPDCRRSYVETMQEVFKLADYEPVDLWVPFLDISKGGILKIGLLLGVPYEKTWTCYDPQYDPKDKLSLKKNRACGKCGACQERLEGFEQAGIKDPISYNTREIIKK
jgi:7-cyano-7-deazaguanine synthase